MEMPVPCGKCHEWVELNSTRESEINKGEMLCCNCSNIDIEVKELRSILMMHYTCLTIMTLR